LARHYPFVVVRIACRVRSRRRSYLAASPARSVTRYVRPTSLARDECLFFERDADAAEGAAHHRGVEPDPALAQQPVAKRLKGDVGFLASQRFKKFSMRLNFRTEVSAHFARRARAAPLEARRPFVAQDSLTPNRAAAARRLILARITASITRSRKSCEYAEAIPAGLRRASRLNQNTPDSGI
jgi:hypothetical protein